MIENLNFHFIQDVKYIDDGDYLCNATNRFGHVHARGKLIVKEQTRITQVTLLLSE